VILGIDPGNHSGWAVLDDHDRLLEHGELRFDLKRQPCPSLIVKTLSWRYTFTMACIESQYLGENPRSCITLAQTAGRWIEACAAAEIPIVVLVDPSTWQHAELSIRGKARRKQRKAASISKCLGLWKIELVDHCADAALIARWAAVESRPGGSLS